MSEWEYFSRNTKPKSVEILEADGARFKTSSGQWVLDFCSQTLNLNLGHRHPVIQEAMFEAAQSYTFLSSRFSNSYSNALVSELVASLPEPLNRVCIKMTSGTEANEGALKAAYKRQGTTSVVAVMKSNHGQSTETMRVAGKHFHRAYLDKSGVSYIDPCNCGAHDAAVTCDCGDQLRELLETLPTVPSALIIEPILVDAGVMVPSANFLHDLRSITEDAGMGLIFDEVQTCMGWTGDLYGLTHFGVTPDIVTFGKAFAAGLPLSATVSKDDWDVMDYGENEFTPGANPVFAAVALANLRLVRDAAFLEGVRHRAQLLRRHLVDLGAAHAEVVADVRGRGFIWAMEIRGNVANLSSFIYDRALERGLLLRVSKVGERSDILQIKPPLITTDEELAQAAAILDETLSEAEATVLSRV